MVGEKQCSHLLLTEGQQWRREREDQQKYTDINGEHLKKSRPSLFTHGAGRHALHLHRGLW